MPAIGKDLSKIRSHLGLTIQDIQHYTKIPVSTLKNIENGSIFNNPEENQIYIRSFVRSYGRALKIDDDLMIKALDQNETGNYNDLLLQEYPELKPEKPAPHEQQQEETKEEMTEEQSSEVPVPSEAPVESEEKPDYLRQGLKKKEPVEASEEQQVTETTTPPNNINTQKIDTAPSVKSVDWADVGRKFSEEKKRTPVWVIGLIIILIVAAVAGYFLYQNGFLDFSSLNQPARQQEQIDDEGLATQSSVSLDFEDSDSPSENEENSETALPSEPAVELDNMLRLTVYAAHGPLGPVRIWSDVKPRMDPYWLEQGTAMHFEFSDTIRVRGSYPDILLFKDGHLIENAAQEFLQQQENYLEITREFFTTDEKWATSVDYELPEGVPPPDSIATRPAF